MGKQVGSATAVSTAGEVHAHCVPCHAAALLDVAMAQHAEYYAAVWQGRVTAPNTSWQSAQQWWTASEGACAAMVSEPI